MAHRGGEFGIAIARRALDRQDGDRLIARRSALDSSSLGACDTGSAGGSASATLSVATGGATSATALTGSALPGPFNVFIVDVMLGLGPGERIVFERRRQPAGLRRVAHLGEPARQALGGIGGNPLKDGRRDEDPGIGPGVPGTASSAAMVWRTLPALSVSVQL